MSVRRPPCALLAALLGCAGLALGCGGETSAVEPPSPEELIGDGPHDVAIVEVEDFGEIRIELFAELTPVTVANFIDLAEDGFYDGTTFHRVIPGFMVQGGDPLSKNPDPRDDGRGGPGYTIVDEFHGMSHVRGMVSMAHRGQSHSAGSQFFIVHQDTPRLDGNYTIFGRVIEGMEIVDAITQMEIDTYGRYGPRNRPYPKDARVRGVRIERAGQA